MIENRSQALDFAGKFKLPDGKTCGSCLNYNWCRDVFQGEKPYSSDSTTCAMGESRFFYNVDFRKPSEMMKSQRRSR